MVILVVFNSFNVVKNLKKPDPVARQMPHFTLLTVADKVLRDKAFNIAKDAKYDGYQRGLASMVYKCFDKKSNGSGIKNEIKENQQLANKLHKPIIRKFKKRRVYASYRDVIWAADLVDMQLINKFNKGFKFLLFATDIFNKCA